MYTFYTESSCCISGLLGPWLLTIWVFTLRILWPVWMKGLLRTCKDVKAFLVRLATPLCNSLWQGLPSFSQGFGRLTKYPHTRHNFWSGQEALSHSGGIEIPVIPVPRSPSCFLCMAGVWYRRRCFYLTAAGSPLCLVVIQSLWLESAWHWGSSGTGSWNGCPWASVRGLLNGTLPILR